MSTVFGRLIFCYCIFDKPVCWLISRENGRKNSCNEIPSLITSHARNKSIFLLYWWLYCTGWIRACFITDTKWCVRVCWISGIFTNLECRHRPELWVWCCSTSQKQPCFNIRIQASTECIQRIWIFVFCWI